jgi:hypothetical protein
MVVVTFLWYLCGGHMVYVFSMVTLRYIIYGTRMVTGPMVLYPLYGNTIWSFSMGRVCGPYGMYGTFSTWYFCGALWYFPYGTCVVLPYGPRGELKIDWCGQWLDP